MSRSFGLRFDASGRALLALSGDGAEFIVLTMLTTGIGSSSLNVDRGQPGSVRRWSIVPRASRMHVIEVNTHFGSSSGRADGRESFAESLLAVLDPAPTGDGTVEIDVTDLVLRDLLGVAGWVKLAGLGSANVDRARSGVDPAGSRVHDRGVEIETILSFTGLTGEAVLEIAPDPSVVTLGQRVSLLPVPDPAMPARRFHPGSGGYGKMRLDTDTDPAESPRLGLQPRFRLDPAGDADESGLRPVVRPIVFSVDPDIPEPYRTAVVEGGSWWARAFDAAGWRDAYRVEVRDRDTDPAAVGVNHVWWVHRSGRGWSMGAALCDPATGEIVKGNVRLGSQRVLQLTALGEALLSPFGRPDEADRRAAIESMVLARIRQLAAHEIGHALGFMHNYHSTEHETPSVMDYPHPRLRLATDGSIDLGDAYAQGVGPWDEVSAAFSYGPAEDEHADAAERHALLARAEAASLDYLTDDDGHATTSAAAGAVPWITGSDPISELGSILAVRRRALDDFGPGCLPPHRPAGEREERFAMVHLLHRNHADAVARLIGGVRYGYRLSGEVEQPVHPVTAARQREALAALMELFTDDVVRPDSRAIRALAPPAIRDRRGPGDFAAPAGPLFDPASATAAAVHLVTRALFEPSRLNRLSTQRAYDDAEIPSPAEVVEAVVAAIQASTDEWITQIAADVAAHDALAAIRSRHLQAPTRAAFVKAARAGLAGRVAWFDAAIDDPTRTPPTPAPTLPLGAPL